MTEASPDRPATDTPVRIEAAPLHRHTATAAQWLLVAAIAGLAWSGMRLAGHFWPSMEDPQVARGFWLLAGAVGLAALSLAWMILLVQDLVKLTIEVRVDGMRVDRLFLPFSARWDEVREIGLVERTGHLTVRTTHGSVTTTARLLGAAPFAALVAALQARAGELVQPWTQWAAARRQLVAFTLPAAGFVVLLMLSQGLWRRSTARGRRR